MPYLLLDNHHNRNGFDCGDDVLNRWFRQVARQHSDKRISSTFVAVAEVTSTEVLGYYAITFGTVVSADLPESHGKRMPEKAPIFLLGRLATPTKYQGMGIGANMLFDAIDRVSEISKEICGIGLVVDAKPKAAGFYLKYGFKQMPEHPDKLFLPF